MPIDKHSAQFITNKVTQPTQSSAPGIWRLEDVNNSVALNRWPLAPNLLRRSLRFNSADSAYLNRTPVSAGNTKIWTWSGWVKRSKLSSGNALFSTVNGSAFNYFSFGTGGGGDQIQFAFYNGSSDVFNVSTGTFRDTSAWYHIVLSIDTTQATSSNRIRIYINSIEQTVSGIFPTQNYDTPINGTISHIIGGGTGSYTNYLFNGYMTEVNFVDGQALTPSSFAETDPQTGVWVPKIYTGTYGTNGFRLNFSNNSSTTTLGYDSSGSGNNFTANNFSITSGTDNDSLLDTPSMYGVDTGLGGEVGGNYCTMNPLNKVYSSDSFANGNLECIGGFAYPNYFGTMNVSSGKWYYEVIVTQLGSTVAWVGFSEVNRVKSIGVGVGSAVQYIKDNTQVNYGTARAVGDVIGIAADLDNNEITFFKNGVSQGVVSNTFAGYTWTPAGWGGGGYTSGDRATANFGQRPFAFPAPAGYKCLTTQNLSTSLGNVSATQANKYFDVITYTGDGAASKSITGLQFQPDLVWVKSRTNASGYHILVDSVRGAGNWLSTNVTNAESGPSQLITQFDSNGFSLNLSPNNTVNETNGQYIALCWKKNVIAGFDISLTTANASAVVTYNHSLGVSPAFVISKSRSAVVPWLVYHKSLGTNQYVLLNSSDAATSLSGVFATSSSQFTITSQTANATYVSYLFAEIPGFSAFGSWTGNGSADGPFIYTGFRPAMIIAKQTNTSGQNWYILNAKSSPSNVVNRRLYPNLTNSEDADGNINCDFLSVGFKLRDAYTGWNANGGTYIYAAFAETPFKNTRAR